MSMLTAKHKLNSVKPSTLMKLDLGCGKNKREGFLGVDIISFEGKTDIICDLTKKWPWKDETVEEANCSHLLEHLEAQQRIHFVNELYRVLIDGGKCTVITPHWASCRAYGDLTHKWPPVSEFWYWYLSKNWRKTEAPHDDIEFNPNGYNCNFEATWGHSMRQDLLIRNQEYQTFALNNYKEAAQDMVATLTKKVPK